MSRPTLKCCGRRSVYSIRQVSLLRTGFQLLKLSFQTQLYLRRRAASLPIFYFASVFSAWSPRSLSHQTLPYVSMVTRMYKIGSEIYSTPQKNTLAVQKHWHFGAISDSFSTWSQISRERNKISSNGNGVANWFVNFVPQTTKYRNGSLDQSNGWPPSVPPSGESGLHWAETDFSLQALFWKTSH